jgi:hypothetical protein
VSGRLVTAWADNSAELGGNPDPTHLDLAFAGVAGGAVGPNVNVTHAPLSQFARPSLSTRPIPAQSSWRP